jgi:hypothetical protein
MTNITPDYHDLIDHLTEAFGTAPSNALTTELADLHARHPAVTRAKAREAADAHAAGRIHSPWGFLQAEMRRHDTAREARPQAADRERDHEIGLAEAWIRNAGLFTPSTEELLDELFGTHGRLKAWADDHELRARMTDTWQANQARATATIEAAHARAETWKAHRRAIGEAKLEHAATTAEPTPHQPKPTPTPESQPQSAQPQPEHATTTQHSDRPSDAAPHDQPAEPTTTPPVATNDDDIPL